MRAIIVGGVSKSAFLLHNVRWLYVAQSRVCGGRESLGEGLISSPPTVCWSNLVRIRASRVYDSEQTSPPPDFKALTTI